MRLFTDQEAGPQGGEWSSIASLPATRDQFTTTTDLSGRLYAIGGVVAGNASSSVIRYDPATNMWTTVASLPSARYSSASATDLSGRIYSLGGTIISTPTKSALQYDPGLDSWTPIADLNYARTVSTGAIDSSGRIYAIGGVVGGSASKTVERFDPSTGTWTMVADMITARGWHASVTDSLGRIYALGGSGGKTCERYDPTTNTWSLVADMITARSQFAAAVDGYGRIYAIGGGNGQEENTVECFDPLTGSWSLVPSMIGARLRHSAVTVGEWIYVLGGANLASVERYWRDEWLERIGPRFASTKPSVVVLHSAGTRGKGLVCPPTASPTAPDWQIPHAARVATFDGFTTWATGSGGINTWGNDTSQTTLASVITRIGSPVILVGISMGWTVAARYAVEHPENVAGMLGIVPFVNFDELWDVFGPYICTGWGVPITVGSSPSTVWAGDPARHTTALASGGFPIEIWRDSADLTVDRDPGRTVISDYATAIGADCYTISAFGHTVQGVTTQMWRAALARLTA